MCNTVLYAVACTSSLLVLSVLGAPVSKENFEEIKSALTSQLKDQEKALESLAETPSESHGIEYSKTKSFSYSNINGAESKHEKAEEKVSEPLKQKLISDMKEEMSEERPSPEAKPMTSYHAEVDVPAMGIHKEITDDGENEKDTETQEDDLGIIKGTMEFTPRVVAEYLYKTGETQEFQNLLNDLVESSEISSEEAEDYEKAVMEELYRLQQEENAANVPQVDMVFPQGYGSAPRPVFPIYGAMQGPSDVYPLYGYAQNPGKFPQDNTNDYVNYVLNKPVTLDDMISAVMDRWLTNAIVNGDPEAEEILNSIVDYVSRDNDPNDEEQVKAILGDIFAEALLEDLSPRIEPQDLQMNSEQLPMTPVKDEVKDAEQKPNVAQPELKTADNSIVSPAERTKTEKEEKTKEVKM